MNNLIVTKGVTGIEIANTQEAVEKRDDLLQIASHHVEITSPVDASEAANLLKEIKEFTRGIEASRTEVKAPILELGKRVDTIARDLTIALETEASRIGKTLAAWQTEQNRIAEEAKQEAWRKEQDLLRQAREKEEAAAREAKRIADEEAEKARKIQEELEAKAANAKTEGARKKALEAAEKARLDAEAAEKARKDAEEVAAAKREEETVQAVVATRVSVAAVAPAKQAGVATRRVPKFKVTDIVKLYEAAPYMVKLEPNDAVILAAIKQLSEGQHLPGVEHYWENVSVVR